MLSDMPRNKNQDKMLLISVHIPKKMLEEFDDLVRRGIFPNRSEAIRAALRDFLYNRELYRPKPDRREEKEEEEEEDFPVVRGRH